MISPVGKGSQRVQSAAHGNRAIPPTRTVRMGPRSFAVSGPTLWNSLPVRGVDFGAARARASLIIEKRPCIYYFLRPFPHNLVYPPNIFEKSTPVLPAELKTVQTPLKSFKSKHKTYLFTKAYDQWSSWNMCNFLMSTCFSFTRAGQSPPVNP